MRARTLLAAIARDEGAYVDEWLDHHLRIGFDRIVVYDNDSDPPLVLGSRSKGRVEVRPWPTRSDVAPQLAAYEDCIARDGAVCDWMMILDIDEFLNLKRDRSVGAFLARFAAADAVGVNWRVFGSSGAQEGEGPVLRRFTRASVREFWPNTHVKTAFRPEAVERAGVHAPVLRPGARTVNARGDVVLGGSHFERWQIAHEVAQVNHYFTKSRAEFAAKRARGKADVREGAPGKHRAAEEFDMHDRNDEEDRTILRRRSWFR